MASNQLPLRSFRLDDETWTLFKTWCHTNHTDASKEIKRHIESLVYNHEGDEKPKPVDKVESLSKRIDRLQAEFEARIKDLERLIPQSHQP